MALDHCCPQPPKVFSLILPATTEKIKFCLFKKTTSCSDFRVNVEISNHAFK